MSNQKAYTTNKAITKYLKAFLVSEGFYRLRPKEFIRVRDDIVDRIILQLSQWGGESFSIYYTCSLLIEIDKEDESLIIGEREVSNERDNIEWHCLSEMHAQKSMSSAIDVFERTIFPYFEQFTTIEDLIVEYLFIQVYLEDICKIKEAFLLLGKDCSDYKKVDRDTFFYYHRDYENNDILYKDKLREHIRQTKNIPYDKTYFENLKENNRKNILSLG